MCGTHSSRREETIIAQGETLGIVRSKRSPPWRGGAKCAIQYLHFDRPSGAHPNSTHSSQGGALLALGYSRSIPPGCGDHCPLEGNHHPFASNARSTTAMRIATPFLTCSRIADCGPSATPAVNSSPRIIGPGCITKASGASAARRWPVSW